MTSWALKTKKSNSSQKVFRMRVMTAGQGIVNYEELKKKEHSFR